MKNLLKRSGIAFDVDAKDEAFVLLHGIGLLEGKLGAQETDGGEKA